MSLIDDVSYLKRAKNRLKVFMALNKPLIPSELTRSVYGNSDNTYFNVVSRALKELVSRGLVKQLNPKEKTGRLYERTAKGNEVFKAVSKD